MCVSHITWFSAIKNKHKKDVIHYYDLAFRWSTASVPVESYDDRSLKRDQLASTTAAAGTTPLLSPTLVTGPVVEFGTKISTFC